MGLGVIVFALSAKYFGVSFDKDVWVLVLNFITVMDLAIWGPINDTFRAKFLFIKNSDGEKKALEATGGLLVLTCCVSVLTILGIVLFREYISTWLAPAYSSAQLEEVNTMLIWLAPCFLVTQMTQICISVLNSYNVFFIPEYSSLATSLINIFVLIILAPHIGIYSLMVAYYCSILILCILVVINVKSKNLNIGQYLKFKYVKNSFTFILFCLPFFFPYFVGQVSTIAEKTMANLLGNGVISIIDYSRKFSDILMSVLSSVLTTMLVPVLTTSFVNKDKEGFVSEFLGIFQLGMLLLTFVIAFFFIESSDIINLLYNHGQISFVDLSTISRISSIYIGAGFPVFFYVILGLCLLSVERGKTLAFLGMLAQIILVVLNYFFYKTYGIYTFPCSLLISHSIVVIVMLILFPFRSKRLYALILKYIGFLLTCVMVSYFLSRVVFTAPLIYLRLFYNGGIVLLTMSLILFLFRMDERRYFHILWNKVANNI